MSNREEFEKQMKGTFGMLVDLRAREGAGFSYMDWGTQVAWVMWQSRVPEGYVVVPMEPTEQILNRMTNAPIEVNHLCDNADIFLSEDEARIAYKAMIEAQEPTND